ncbi:AAA family ATPase [Ralstonia pseudosolanacearum]|uniref:AAA family ATPase n=1 Tax=Ralstonia pseudosolanacearum TaxID=1310165 RepID=UPI0002D5A0EB|nr:AAA family ATPase [Ralstonia pseudosolanacearum]MCK4125261.1 AAA family ATPase [Ralstonia pseudosolanacearum]
MTDEAPQSIPNVESKSRRLMLALSSLYLDPNNYRFIDHDDYAKVQDGQITDDEVQRRTRRLILGPNEEKVSDLVASLKQNGWLEVEPIHVRKLGERQYLVVEGNRRVATLKHLQSRWQDSTGTLGKLDSNIFDKVPCILYEERDDFHHLVVMGLHHISGKARWPAVNQARLMERLRNEFKKDPEEICASLGVSKREFNLSLRTLALADAYSASDYGDQFTSDMFNLFREVLKAPSLRNWLEWDNDIEKASNSANMERLFSWLSREPEEETEEEDESENGAKRVLGERVITTGGQIRELAKVIEDPVAVKRLEETRSLQAATLSSDLLVKNEIDGAIERSNQDAARLFELAPKMSSTELDRVENLVARLEAVAVSRKRQPATATISEQPWKVFTEVPQSHFESINVGKYRALNDISFEKLGRVNLIVGINNAGKTSALEAVYLLANQVDPRGLLELLRRRTRMDLGTTPAFSVTQLPREVALSGHYDKRADNAVSLTMTVKDEPEDTDEDWSSYLRTLVMDATYAGRAQRSVTDFFSGRVRRTRLKGEPRWLASSVFHSPFSLSDPELLTRCYEESIRLKLKERVVEFIRTHIDAGVRDIELANEYRRFLVTHDSFGEAVDLASFGEGVQRVFLTGLLVAGARGGVVLIDEFENALHTGVLLEFTRFVHELASEFECQIFVTTHSKETVDAFLLNGYRIEEVVAYLLKRDDKTTKSVVRFSGDELKRAVELGDVDLRRL